MGRHSQNLKIKFVIIIGKRILDRLINMVRLAIKIRDTNLNVHQEYVQCTYYISKDSKILQTYFSL